MVLTYFGILDDIVQVSLKAVSGLDKNNLERRPVIIGGMALQAYVQETLRKPELLRPTSDIDVMTIEPFRDFRDFDERVGEDLVSRIRKLGYQAQPSRIKHRNSYQIKVMRGQGNKARELFFINFDYPSDNVLSDPDFNEKRRREIANANITRVGDIEVMTVRIEDILSDKKDRIQRAISHLPEDHEIYLRALSDIFQEGRWEELRGVPLEKWNDRILKWQNRFDDAGQIKKPWDYILNKDLYDVCLLMQVINREPRKFNRSYYLGIKP
ncbi:hypothetical protein J4467_02125 [Candidatus Woesearchaeota archaeon]|nr:hypothetical protein [Candidatus Woesearchaeota archaeon]